MQRSIGGFEYFCSFKIEKGSKLTEIKSTKWNFHAVFIKL